jgi:HEPN domain-containing protein
MKPNSDVEIHLKAAQEKRSAAHEEFEKKRYTVVGDLAIKTVEQAIEALAALEGKHFHSHPRSAHSNRTLWIKEKIPSLAKDLDELWGAYGALGYEGIDGERATKVIDAMERVLREIERETRVRIR